MSASGADREPLGRAGARPTPAPSSTGLSSENVQRVDDIAAHQISLGKPRQLEDAATDREHAAVSGR